MKSNTSVTIDAHVLARVRAVANAEGESISTFLERAARHELMYLAGRAVTDWERRHDVDVEAEAVADLELQSEALGQIR
ncbi:ribbon-helix-helix protein, CopG family [Nocardia sp. NPDC127526]|uniref:ribbon-helix-helix protein, CopG family n=1 Tax=Nocardia sp. NPDC127526 TaxID=3345393 RepID=UPI003634A52D